MALTTDCLMCYRSRVHTVAGANANCVEVQPVRSTNSFGLGIISV